MYAVRKNPNLGVVEAIIAAGADVNAQDKEDCTPLMHAARNATPAIIETLISVGADINVQDKSGMTPLMHAAAGTRNPKVIEILLISGADAKLRSYAGKTAFDYPLGNKSVTGTDAYWLLNDARF